MHWHEITIHTTEEASESLSYFLHTQGAGGVSIEETGSLERKRDTSYGQLFDQPFNDIPEGEAVIKAYFPIDPAKMDSPIRKEIEQLQLEVQNYVVGLRQYDLDPGKAIVTVKEVDDEDWAHAWKQYFKPVQVTDRLTIKPTWESYQASDGEVIIELDPGMAFGTGTHATTILCLQLMDQYVKSGMLVVDVGTGSGILAVAAAKLGAQKVLALDLDPVAVSIAKENIQLNGLDIEVKESDLLQAMSLQEPADLIVANILAEIILMFIDEVFDALRPGGIYITSGIIGRKADQVEAALVENGFYIMNRIEQEDWVAFAAQKAGE